MENQPKFNINEMVYVFAENGLNHAQIIGVKAHNLPRAKHKITYEVHFGDFCMHTYAETQVIATSAIQEKLKEMANGENLHYVNVAFDHIKDVFLKEDAQDHSLDE
jgi:hypothetical protein